MSNGQRFAPPIITRLLSAGMRQRAEKMINEVSKHGSTKVVLMLIKFCLHAYDLCVCMCLYNLHLHTHWMHCKNQHGKSLCVEIHLSSIQDLSYLCSMGAMHSSCRSAGKWPSVVHPGRSFFCRGSGCQSQLHIQFSGRPPRSPDPPLGEAGSTPLREWKRQITSQLLQEIHWSLKHITLKLIQRRTKASSFSYCSAVVTFSWCWL